MAYVLVVDDDADGREPLCRLLESAGHEVACAADGREALSMIIKRTPDLAIFDLFMPHMDGAELLRILRSYARFQNMPVIILTASASNVLLLRADELNIRAILTKAKTTLDQVLQVVTAELSRASPPPAPPEPPYHFRT